MVRKNNGGDGVVRAIFTTKDGELPYAVEKEGALDFVDETKLSHQQATFHFGRLAQRAGG